MSGKEVEKTNNQITLPETLNIPTKQCVLMYNLINVVTKRGGINSDEFTVVGQLVDWLRKELKVDEQQMLKNKQNNDAENSENVD